MSKINKIGCSILTLFFLAIMLYGCKKDDQNSSDDSSVRLEFIYEENSTPSISYIDIFIFDENETLIEECHLAEPNTIIDNYNLNISDGDYTTLAVANLSEELYAQIVDDLTFIEAVNHLHDNIDNIYIGYTQTYIKSGITLQFDMVSLVSELNLSELVLNIKYPIENIDDMPIYDTKSTQSTPLFRTITQISNSSNDVIYKNCSTWTMTEATKATKSFMLYEGDYTVKIWCDYVDSYTEDLYYDTSDMDNVEIMPIDSYTANSDYRNIFAAYKSITLTEEQTIVDIEAYQPVAKYSIITQDIEKYNQLRVSNEYPAIEDLDIMVEYNGYLPSGYNISTERLTSSQLGYSYSAKLDDQNDGCAVVAKDFVLVNRDAESSIQLNITISGDGVTICKLSGLKVEYKSGYHTLLYANFLTDYISSGGDGDDSDSGGSGGLNLEFEWEGVYNFEF